MMRSEESHGYINKKGRILIIKNIENYDESIITHEAIHKPTVRGGE